MKTTICECKNCNKKFERPIKEVERSKKLGRVNYCSRKCAGIGNKEVGKKNLGNELGNIERIKKYCKNRINEYTPFKQHLRSAKSRFKEVDIDLPHLKEVWEKQEGVCPFTGWQLSLKRTNSPSQASLDRIDSNKGYVKGNVRFIALIANYCKNNFTDEEVINFCKFVSSKYLST